MQGLVCTGMGLLLTAWICSRRGRRLAILVPSFLLIALADLAVRNPEAFGAIVEQAKEGLAAKAG